ncbi:MAG: DNA mismatch repair endonuclease MutL, partial [Mariprofundales bacterium]
FRGEALPSIASVSRFRLHTCLRQQHEGVESRVDADTNRETRPAAARKGTLIEVRDLFLNTPARLRFMRSNKTEEAAITEVVRALALANPSVAMQLMMDGRKRLQLAVADETTRIMAVMGKEFAANNHHHTIVHEGIEISAFLGLPTYHNRSTNRMLFLLNGRAIRDKMLISALRAGYRDVLFHDRYPIAVVQIHIDPEMVDINVHPAKREVRFAKPGAVRAAIVACVTTALEEMGQRSASTTSDAALQAMATPQPQTATAAFIGTSPTAPIRPAAPPRSFHSSHSDLDAHAQQLLFSTPSPAPASSDSEIEESAGTYHTDEAQPEASTQFGHPIGQIHQRYLLTQTADGVLLIDQHAAHERIGYEQLKQQLAQQNIVSQPLLTPEAWSPSPEISAWLHDHPDALKPYGVDLDPLDDESFSIRAVPSLLGHEPPQALVAELADAAHLLGGESLGLGRVLERWLGNRACKGAITSGQQLNHQAQLALLQQMATTPNIAQCNHGRPTWVSLSMRDLDRLFGRKG